MALFLVLGLAATVTMPGNAAADHHPRVLVIHSYHQGFRWTDNVMRGIREVFDGNENIDFELYVEYLDTKRFAPESLFAHWAGIFRAKYSGLRPDVILTSDDNGFQFILAYGDDLFPGVPVVFCGVNNFHDSLIQGRDDITGVLESFDIRSTLDLMFQLHPQAGHLALITDATPTAVLNRDRFFDIYPAYADRAEIIDLANLTTEELLDALVELPADTVILNLSFFRDRQGKAYSTVEGNRLITDATDHPVYSCWDFFLDGTGVVGGMVVSGRQQGIEAATMALDILSGTAPADIPLMRESPNRHMFDYPAMRAAGIDIQDIPDDSIVLNRPESFYSRYRQQIHILAGAFMLMLILMVVMGVNILQRRKARLELDRIFENSQVGIMYLQGGRIISRVNPRMAEIFGFGSPDEIKGRSVEILHRDRESYEEFGRKYYNALGSGERVQAEYQARRQDGQIFWCLITGKAVDKNSPPDLSQGVIWTIDDITERKKAVQELQRFSSRLESLVRERTTELNRRAEELEKANVQLRKLDVMKSTFLSTVSHDLRTPLTSILGFVKVIIRDFGSICRPESLEDPDLRKRGLRITDNLTIIEEEARRLTRLINDCLDLSRIEEGKVQWDDRPVRLPELAGQALTIVSGEFDQQPGLSFRLHCQEPTPWVLADPDRIIQVLVNLLNNAAKFSARGEVLLEVDMETTDGDTGWVRVSITDHGPGIPVEDLAMIFDKFYQVQCGDTVGCNKGSGMGLAICKQIVDHYGGDIWAESVAGSGSTFRFRLPAMHIEPDKA